MIVFDTLWCIPLSAHRSSFVPATTQYFCAFLTNSKCFTPWRLSLNKDPLLGTIGKETTTSVPPADHTDSSTIKGLDFAIACVISDSLFICIFRMYIGECSAWMPDAVWSKTDALPDGFTQVVRAAGLIPIILATSLLTFLTMFAPFFRIFSSKRILGLFIHPVMETPNSASRSNIFFDVSEMNLKSVYPACIVPRIAAARHA